jgi:lipopolysaccharide transport system permease protein
VAQNLASLLGKTVQVTKIKPRTGWIDINWKELFQYRELLFFLIWRDILVRYKQTVLGIAWAVLQPVFMMLVFSVIFGRLAKIGSEGFPYAVYVYAGLLPWTFFANAVTQSGQSLVSQQHLLTKIYFPRLFVPTASVGAGLVDLAISCFVYAGILYYYGVVPSINVLFLPLLVCLTVIAALGFGYTLAALTVTYRDFRFVIPFMIQVMMYLSPVVYPVTMIPEKFHLYLAINPMTGIIHAYRSAILGTPFNPEMFAISVSVAFILFIYGLFYFRKTERRFADIV